MKISIKKTTLYKIYIIIKFVLHKFFLSEILKMSSHVIAKKDKLALKTQFQVI